MISLNNLLQSVVRSAEEYHRLNDNFRKTERIDFISKKELQREVVIINPTYNGNGDFELAKKLEQLIASKGLQTTTISLKQNENASCYENVQGKQKKMESNFVIIAPFSFCSPESLTKIFKDNIHFREKELRVVMIDEIEAASQYSFNAYKDQFQKIGIKHVHEEKLGFGKDCIGYLPIKESECMTINQRSKTELKKLFDSFNLNIDFSAYYYVSYLSSNIKVTASQVFIINTLYEIKENPSSVNYIFSLGEGDWESDVKRISKGVCSILSDLEDSDKDIARKFSKLNVILIDVYKNQTLHTQLQNRKEEGIPINLIFMNSKQMPKNVWHNFIAMSKSGIMTGDQSFCDYLSIKKQMPFYEMQHWKWPLRQSLMDNAEEFGGKQLKEYVETKIFGRMPPYGDIFYQFNCSMIGNQLKEDFQSFGEFLSKKIAKDFMEAYLNEKNVNLTESLFSHRNKVVL